MCGQSAKRDCQVESSWSRDDHEDGGPTIQLPAAEPAAPLTCLPAAEYSRRSTAAQKFRSGSTYNSHYWRVTIGGQVSGHNPIFIGGRWIDGPVWSQLGVGLACFGVAAFAYSRAVRFSAAALTAE